MDWMGGAVARLNDVSPCGDMMYLLRKYDVARSTRNEAMSAKNVANRAAPYTAEPLYSCS